MKREQKLSIPSTDILAVLAVTALFVFALAFGGKLLEGYRLQRHNAMLLAELDLLKEQHRQLLVRLEEVKTPEYVEQVAREQYRWAKPGESLVIPIVREQPPVASASAQSAGSVDGSYETQTAAFWPAWSRLLLGGE